MSIKKFFIVWKVRFSYANSFIGMFGMIILITSAIQAKLADVNIILSYSTILLTIITLTLVFAWALDYFGFYTEELNYGTEKSTKLHQLIKEK